MLVQYNELVWDLQANNREAAATAFATIAAWEKDLGVREAESNCYK